MQNSFYVYKNKNKPKNTGLLPASFITWNSASKLGNYRLIWKLWKTAEASLENQLIISNDPSHKICVSLKQHNVCSLHKFEDHCEIAKHKIPTLSQLNDSHKTFFLSILRCRLLNLHTLILPCTFIDNLNLFWQHTTFLWVDGLVGALKC